MNKEFILFKLIADDIIYHMTKQIIKPQLLKGFRDFLPQEVIKRNYLRKKIEAVFNLYGFQPIETPALEYLETFSGNIGADEKLFFNFEDQGGRKVALRYDQTVPTCRFVAQNKNELTFPFKRYQIQTVWRSEKPQKGRYREFLQCDADIFGISGYEADAEMIALSLGIYKKLGFEKYIVKINDRSIFQDIPYPVVVAVDKLAKIGHEKVIEEIVRKGYSQDQAIKILDKISKSQPTEPINKIMTYLSSLNFTKENYLFEPTLARSFNYSSGIVWEVVIPGFESGSVLGGERYDKLMDCFQNQNLPATGFGLGFDRTFEAMEQFKLFPENQATTKVLVTVFSPELFNESIIVAAFLRDHDINTDLYLNPTVKLDKQLKYADKNKIAYVIIIGPAEAEKNIVKLKNMNTGEQKELTIKESIKFLID